MTPEIGRDALIRYYDAKGSALRQNRVSIDCTLVKLVGSMKLDPTDTSNSESFALWYESGKPCLYVEQALNGQTRGMIVDIHLDKDGMIGKIALYAPELFRFVPYEKD